MVEQVAEQIAELKSGQIAGQSNSSIHTTGIE
jgi:hypothetical protein